MKFNICWECGNACANKCEYIRSGQAIKGWTAQKGKGNYLISQCPNFVTDGDIGLKNIAKALGWTDGMILGCLRYGKIERIVERAKEKGYKYSCQDVDDRSRLHLLVPLNQKRGLDSNDNLQWQRTLL